MSEAPRSFVKKEKLTRHEEYDKSQEKQLLSRVEITGQPGEDQEISVIEGGRKVNLNSFLPRDVHFAGSEGRYFRYLAKGRDQSSEGSVLQIEFPPEKLSTLNGRLSLLHEIGHSYLDREYKKTGKELSHKHHYVIIDAVCDVAAPILKSDAYKTITSEEGRKSYYLAEFKKAWRTRSEKLLKETGVLFRYNDVVSALSHLEEDERDSWAQALQLRRRIKKESGIDLLEGADLEEIFSHIEVVSLGSYERAYAPLLRLAGEKEELPPRDFVDKILDGLFKLALK